MPETISVSDKLFDPVWKLKFHANPTHELLHVVRGKLELTYRDGTIFPAEAGDTLFNFAGKEHKDVFDTGEELEIFYICFKWKHDKQYFNIVDNHKLTELSANTTIEMRKIFDTMRFDAGNSEIDRVLANSRLMNILMLIYRDATVPAVNKEAGVENRHKKMIKKAKAYIDRSFQKAISLEEVAAHLKASPFYLSRIFSRESDFSFVEYLTEVRMNEAKKLLRDGRYIVADVAMMVGYEDSTYFSRVFKKRFGCSPGKFR